MFVPRLLTDMSQLANTHVRRDPPLDFMNRSLKHAYCADNLDVAFAIQLHTGTRMVYCERMQDVELV